MTPKEYCYKKCYIAGSAFYYSVKQLSVSQRDAMVAVQAFYLELEDILFHFTDSGVARARFNWWKSEVVKIAEGKPDHPVSLYLQCHKISVEKLFTLVEGMEECLSYLQFSSFEDVVIHLMRTAGVKEILFAEILQPNHVIDAERVYQAMLVIELVYYIQHLRRYVQRDVIYFAEDEMQKFHVKRSDFSEYKTTDAIRGLLSFQSEKIEKAYAGIISSGEVNPCTRMRMDMAYATLKVIKDGQFNVLESYIDITPLKRWWMSVLH